MRSGKLNTLCRLERKGEDLGLGLKVRYEPTGDKLWVELRQLSGNELLAAQQIEARASLELSCHWQPDVRVGDRLVEETTGRTFNLVAVDNVGNRNRELRLTAIEVVT